jgi:hypothetical protein
MIDNSKAFYHFLFNKVDGILPCLVHSTKVKTYVRGLHRMHVIDNIAIIAILFSPTVSDLTSFLGYEKVSALVLLDPSF